MDFILLQTEMAASLIGEIAKVGGVPAVLALIVWYLMKENKQLKEDNKELQNELKAEIKATTAFSVKMKELLEKFKS